MLKKSFYTYIFYVQLLIMCTTLDLLTQCFLFMLFVQTGNQHIYQPIGKQGNRHNSKMQLQSYNCWCFIITNCRTHYLCEPNLCRLILYIPQHAATLCVYRFQAFCTFYSIKHCNFETFCPFFY